MKTYLDRLRCISRKTETQNDKIPVITDGEPAIYQACDEVFPHCIRLRCMRHFEKNIDEFIINNNLTAIKDELKELVLSDTGLFEIEDDRELQALLSSKELEKKITYLEKP